MKTKEEKKGFIQGMGTMLMASVGTDIFGQGGWLSLLGYLFMIASFIMVYVYVKSE